ncbi:hypothetical protein SE15_13095 [Thermanaerothrix daxensis]|uniref:DegV family protein n=1 Tax=Thermanaerothrix daxensis TaxID=869279 RepID=A0A0N8GPW7_9CHLR|nr:DegV family protein [Thermanaerothrix daxensis]KPL82050.1 hypothetical protein SE15_13095 [Thermanaerothrix daxensis]
MTYPVALIADSTCDLPPEWVERYGILIVPQTIIFGREVFLDGIDMTPEAFYERLERTGEHPTTSQPPPEAFVRAFHRAAEQGAREIITFVVSSHMSGTYRSALQAAAESPVPVHVVDSCNNSMGMGWQIMAAARVREQGGDVAEMLRAAQKVREAMVYFVALDTLDFLQKGGRIGAAARLLGSLIQIKPLVYVKPSDGTVAPSMPARSRTGVIENLFREFFKRLDTSRPLHIAVLHNLCPADAEALARRVEATYHPAELIIRVPSPVLGAHTGPRAIALCGYAEPA